MNAPRGVEQHIIQLAVGLAHLSKEELISRLAHLRRAPNQTEARKQREALLRVARVRRFVLPRVARCPFACCSGDAARGAKP